MVYKPLLSHLPSEEEISAYHPMYSDLPTEDEISSAFPNQNNQSASQMLLEQVQGYQPKQRSFLDEVVPPEAREGIRTVAGTTAGFLVPELKIPGVSKAITSGIEGMSPFPKMMANYARNIGKAGAGGAAANMIMSDEGNLMEKAGRGGRVGEIASAVLQPLGAILPGASPIIRALIGAGVGALGGGHLGAGVGHRGVGEIVGGALGGTLGLGKRGMQSLATKNLLSKANPAEVLARETAAKEIGVPLTMTEAIGTPVAGKLMASLYSEPTSAQRLYEFGEQRKPLEANAIQNLLDITSPKGSYKNIEEPLYKMAENKLIPIKKFSEIIKDPYMNKQLNNIFSDLLYSQELQTAQPNSIKVLDLLKRRLDSEMETATKSEGKLIGDKLKNLRETMDEISPEYKEARQVSEKRKTRESIEERMNDAEISGSNFYNKFLKNDNEYDRLYYSLRNPEKPEIQSIAQKKLQAMKTTFPLLIDPMNAKIASTIAESKIPIFGKFADTIKDNISNLLFKQYNTAITDMITSNRFDKQFEKLYKIKNKEKRARDLANILSKSASLGITRYGESENH